MKYRFLLPVLALFVLVLSSCEHRPDDRAIRVMSYNIAAGFGDLDRIADVIRSEDPDVVALQEVDVHWGERSEFEDQARALGESLNMEYFFGPIYTLEPEMEGAPPREYGLAYLSRHPIVRQENHVIARLSTQWEDPVPEPLPGFPEIVVEIDGTEIRFFNTHLDYRGDPAVRIMQIEDMLETMGELDTPTLLLGDLNARPDAAELEPLFAVFNDVWENEDGPGYTFPADAPDRRIDYILHTPHFEVSRAYVVETTASDHRPVVADLSVMRGGTGLERRE